ncbi:MAG: M24 family metallopeptidase [Clostridia bacterium]|nr:M24 family metallopeptidase [Clostridia bacterium]
MMPFERDEYLVRMKKVQQSMSKKGIDVLLITDPANMCYLSGHNAWSFYVHQMLVVTLDDEMPIFIGRYMDAFSGVVKTTWLDEGHVRAYSDDYVQSTIKHPMDYVCDVIKELGAQNKTIAVEKDNYYFTASAYESLLKGLPNAKFVDGNVLVNWIRIIKSDNEIALQRKAGKIAELAMTAAIDNLKPGVRQCDVVAAIYDAQIRGTAEFGGDYASIVPLLPAGEAAGAPHLTWSDEKYPDNIVVAIELAGCCQRYHSPMARTVSIGKPSDKVSDVAKITVEGLNAALATVKPGIYLEEVELAWRNVISQYGIEKESRIGYSMGLNYPPDWGEHTASIRSGDKTVLQPNMTFHCIPGMYFDDFGVSISEAFMVTETGHETFANFPRKLFVNE